RHIAFDVANNAKTRKKILEHYGRLPTEALITNREDLFRMAREVHENARHTLTVDGYHYLFVYTFKGVAGVAFEQLGIDDPSQKALFLHAIAEQMRREGADAIMIVGEMWLARFDPAHPNRSAEDAPDRSDVLTTALALKEGRGLFISSDFTKDDAGKV